MCSAYGTRVCQNSRLLTIVNLWKINAENPGMHKGFELTALPGLAVVRVRGPDAAKFLQGQISNDSGRLGAGRSILAGYHNPQGRVIALLRLVWLDQDD